MKTESNEQTLDQVISFMRFVITVLHRVKPKMISLSYFSGWKMKRQKKYCSPLFNKA